MSLNFVSSAVLTSTDGVSHNEEKAVETTEANSVRRQQEAGGHRPLFEQLRSNADQAQEERDAAAKAMRGTRTLDEDDCAHLDSIERRRMERDAAVRRGVEDEVAAFRAARAERMAEGSTELPGEEEEEGGGGGGDDDAGDDMKVAASKPSAAVRTDDASGPSLAKLAPKFVIKKKRKRQSPGSALSGDATTGSTSTAGEDATSKRQKDKNEVAQKKEQDSDVVEDNKQDGDNDSGSDDDAGGGLGALLGGYGSDSDSE